MQDADAEASPVGAVLGGEAVHGRVGAQPGDEPSAVGHGAEAEHVLFAALLDVVPGGAAAGLALAGDPTSNSGEPLGERFGREAGKARDQPVRRQDQAAPGRSCRRASSGRSSTGRRGRSSAGLRPVRRDISGRSRSDGGRRR